MSFPSSRKREPWQGQSQECSARLYLSAQPMWGHRGAVGVRSPAADASTFPASGSPGIRREGEKRSP